ncbi:hypothetical protein [Nonomuraea dietziae]|uniref:hypothetical protein n=1 Tax=Nonomuraea dietziae TaxID=65515 RepID=UPI0031E4684A
MYVLALRTLLEELGHDPLLVAHDCGAGLPGELRQPPDGHPGRRAQGSWPC